MIRLQDETRAGKLTLLLDHNSIQNRIRGLAKEICQFYEWEKDELVVVGLADGANMFVSDLIRLMSFRLKSCSIKVNTYCGTEKCVVSTIDSSLFSDSLCSSIENNHVLIVDTILDTGESINSIIKAVEIFKPKTIKTAILLCKNRKREFDIKPDFCGFNIKDSFVVGFGLDHNNYYRNLVDICELKDE